MHFRQAALKTGQFLTLREARGQDAAALLEYIEQISHESDFLTFGSGEFTLTVEQEFDYLEKSFIGINSIYFLAILDNKIVGTLNFTPNPRPRNQHAGEFGMSVLKDYSGQGIGSILLERLIEWAKKGGMIKKINLRVRTDNERAIGLYRKCGFEIEGTLRKEMYVNDQYYDNYWMGLVF